MESDSTVWAFSFILDAENRWIRYSSIQPIRSILRISQDSPGTAPRISNLRGKLYAIKHTCQDKRSQSYYRLTLLITFLYFPSLWHSVSIPKSFVILKVTMSQKKKTHSWCLIPLCLHLFTDICLSAAWNYKRQVFQSSELWMGYLHRSGPFGHHL